MNEFDRSINVDALTEMAKRLGETWLTDLLKAWVPSGHPTNRSGLRLAIRNGTLNFYTDGQSVGQVGIGLNKQPYVRTHVKYTDPDSKGKHYLRFNADADRSSYNIAKWTTHANEKSGAEKKFVEKVVAQNETVIDLEMAFPLGNTPARENGRSSAPRIDLVAIEERNDGLIYVVFWEVKLIADARLVSKAATEPKVFKQLDQYAQYLNDKEKIVRDAYARNCKLLVDLRELARASGNDMPELSPLVGLSEFLCVRRFGELSNC